MLFCFASSSSILAQDWIKTGTGLGVERMRIAVPEFKAANQDPRNTELLRTFNETLWNDLSNAGIFEMISKSFYPLGQVGAPGDVKFDAWGQAPVNAAMLVFGDLGASGNSLTVQGWLFDVKNPTSPQVLARRESSRISLPMRSSSALAAESTESRKPRFTTSARAAVTKRSGPWTTMEPTSTR
jgi:TolB protein